MVHLTSNITAYLKNVILDLLQFLLYLVSELKNENIQMFLLKLK